MSYLIPHFHRRAITGWGSDFDRLFASFDEDKMLSLDTDIEESDDHILMTFDLPGMKESDFSVKVVDGTLMITGEKKREEKKTEKSQVVYSRRSYGKFEKSYSLPENVDGSNIEADYRDGVLRLYLPKIKVEESKAVDVKIKNKDSFFDRLLGSTKN